MREVNQPDVLLIDAEKIGAMWKTFVSHGHALPRAARGNADTLVPIQKYLRSTAEQKRSISQILRS
jgi:hypothetical protein